MKLFHFKTLPGRIFAQSLLNQGLHTLTPNQETKLSKTKTCQNQKVLFHSIDKFKIKPVAKNRVYFHASHHPL